VYEKVNGVLMWQLQQQQQQQLQKVFYLSISHKLFLLLSRSFGGQLRSVLSPFFFSFFTNLFLIKINQSLHAKAG
jgi:hypothetical protein